jgi:uncharacterized phage protein gp47/JayE
VRKLTRDYVLSQLGARGMLPNSVLRIMSDAMAGQGFQALLYLDWLAKQLMPDTAETEWLDRFGVIWLTNADGSKGRKAASYAAGVVQFQGNPMVLPIGTTVSGMNGVLYQTTTEADIGDVGIGTAEVVAQTAGAIGNLPDGDSMMLTPETLGVTANALGDITGGADQENDDQLRERILFRIQNPPMGGSQADYIAWAMEVPGVTRAWAACEMGPGTMTVRFLMDGLYPDNHGLPTPADIMTVQDFIDTKRPVTVMDTFVMAPILYFYDITIRNLVNDDPNVMAGIETSIQNLELLRSQPGQTWYRSWVDEAISQTIGETSHELDYETTAMPAPGYMPCIGTILYA